MADRLQRWLVVLATLATLAVNALASTVGINGIGTGEVAVRYDLPFTPAGWVFSIWGLIYAGLVAFTVYQLAGAGRRSARAAAVRPVYVFSAAANGTWLWFWHHEALLSSLAVMLLLLFALLAARRTLAAEPPASMLETCCLDAPFRLYLAWITVAALANLSVVVTAGALTWLQADATGWSLTMIAAVVGIGILAFAWLREPLWLAVIGWALAGVALKAGQEHSVSVTAAIAAALAGLGCIILLLEDARRPAAQSTTG